MIARNTIRGNLKTLLAGITVAGGYNTTLTGKVFEWRIAKVAADQLPTVVIRDAEREQPTELTGVPGRHDHRLHIVLHIGASSEDQAIEVIQDCLKAIATDPTLSGTAIDVIDEGDSLDAEHQGEKIFAPELRLGILYRTTRMQES